MFVLTILVLFVGLSLDLRTFLSPYRMKGAVFRHEALHRNIVGVTLLYLKQSNGNILPLFNNR